MDIAIFPGILLTRANEKRAGLQTASRQEGVETLGKSTSHYSF